MDGALEKRLNELALRAGHTGRVCATRFLEPSALGTVNAAAARAGVKVALWGGYEGAERCQLHFLPEWAWEAEEGCVRAIRCRWHHSGELTHRDFLGSLMGMGITRESVGDILVSQGSADVLVSGGVADFLLQSWESAGRVHLQTEEIRLSHLHIPVAASKTMGAEAVREAILAGVDAVGENRCQELTEKLARVNENLARKIASRNEFDRTIAETAPAMIPFTLSQGTPKVGGHSAASSTPRRPEVPAPI